METSSTTWVSVIATLITVLGTVAVAFLNRAARKENKPLKDVLTRTKIEGNGSLVEALGVLQRQLTDEQVRYDKQIKDIQQRHRTEIEYYVEQLKIARIEIAQLRLEKDAEIRMLRERLDEFEQRLNKEHIG